MAESSRSLHVLLIEDSEEDALLVIRELRRAGFEPSVEIVDTSESLDRALKSGEWDVVLTDFNLPTLNGLDVVRRVRLSDPDLPCIIVSGAIGETVAVEAVRSGARDYVMKDRLQRLGPTVDRELEDAQRRVAQRRAEEALAESQLRYRAIVNDHHEMIVRWRPDGAIVVANQAFADLEDQEPQDLVGENFLTGFDEATFSRLTSWISSVVREQPLIEDERSREVGPGNIRFHSWSHRALFSDDGCLVEMQSVGRDVTERRELEDLDLRQRRLTSAMCDTAAVLASTIDLGEALDRLLMNLQQLIPLEAATVLLNEEYGIRVARTSGSLLSESTIDRIDTNLTPSELAMLSLVAAAGSGTMVPDTGQEPTWPRDSPELEWVACAAAAPLTENEDIFGYLVILSATPHRWDEQALSTLDGFAGYVAAAVRKAQIFSAAVRDRERLRLLSSQLEEAHEQERRRISLELHDEVGQSLTGIGMNLEWVKSELGAATDPQVIRRLGEATELTTQVMRQVRELSHRLRPSMLDDLGLESALHWFLGRFEGYSEISCRLETSGLDGDRLPAEIETVFFRLAQEAITNVAKHAGASSILVRLDRSPRMASLLVEDDGCGFEMERLHSKYETQGIGLVGMRERLSAIGGKLHLRSEPGCGVELLAEVPLATTE